MKKIFRVGGLALVVGLMAAVMPAGAQESQDKNLPQPTLRVMKTYPENRAAPEGTVFTVVVDCQSKVVTPGDVSAETIPVTTLTFIAGPAAKGQPAVPAAPDTTDNDKWVKDGNYWSFTSQYLQYRICTVEETDASSTGGLAALTVKYQCDFSSTKVEKQETWVPVDEAEATGGYGASPGCVNPLNGEQVAGPTPPAEVQFTVPWDFIHVPKTCSTSTTSSACSDADALNKRGPKSCDAGPPLEDEGSALEGSKQLCQQLGTITVINDEPDWSVLAEAAEAVTIPITFTG